MEKKIALVFFLFIAHFANAQIEFWQTKQDKSVLFEKRILDETPKIATEPTTLPTIFIDETKKFQQIDGFGYTLTGGSATLIHQMSAAARAALLNELFGTEGKNIGISYLRISIGASDLDATVFSYNDNKNGIFSLSEDKKALIPVLQEILKINPTIKILGSPWSPPAWLKSNENTKGGSLKPNYYDTYAQYFVKYIQAMKAEGIAIDAITVQNEPLNPDNNPSLLMYAYEQANFIKKSLGIAFKKAGIKTKILIYDHNADRPDYPIEVLNDKIARQYIDGTAFHLYGGVVEAISDVHNAHPDKNLYFTEQWTGSKGTFAGDLSWHTRTLIIGTTRNWCKTVLEWNLAADPQLKPHTEGGCTECLGALTIDNEVVTRNVSYYIIAHASKFVRPNSVRIFSNLIGDLPNVAFKTPDGKIVLIAQNDGSKDKKFVVSYKGKILTLSLDKASVGTWVF